MPSIIDQAKEAGFSDQEIGSWATGFREQARAAGFNDAEISGYLGGTVVPPQQPPPAFVDRLAGAAASAGRGLAPIAIGAGAGAALGAPIAGVGAIPGAALGGTAMTLTQFAAALYAPLAKEFGWPAAPTPQDMTDKLLDAFGIRRPQNLPERMIEATAAGAGGAVGVARGAAQLAQSLTGTARAVTEQLAEGPGVQAVSGAVAGAAGQGAAEAGYGPVVQSLAQILGGAVPYGFIRPKLDPLGNLQTEHLGAVPQGEDFAQAAKMAVGPEAPLSTQDKLMRLYTGAGVHPAEVASDAQQDVTISQALASRAADLPEQYELGGALAPKTEAEPALSPSPETPAGVSFPVRSFRPGDLTVDADRFQFKAGGDEQGVTDRLQGVSQWDPIKAGLSLIWEDKSGQRFIVDGHQRYGLAQRIAAQDPSQDPKLNGIVVREADGVSDVEARVMAASKNIAEGTGTAIDAAKVLRDQPELINELPPRSELVRQARGLANLGDEPFRAIVNQVTPANYGAIVGRLAPNDPKLQGALIELLAKTEPANATQAEAIVRQGISAGTHAETQASLFGDEEVVSSLYLDRAKILDRALRELRRDRQVFNTLVRDQDIVTAVGNRLEASANEQRLAADSQAVQILQILANRHGALSDALSAAARRSIGGDGAAAVRDFVAAVRREAESGNLLRAADGIGRGRADVAAEDAASVVDPTAASPSQAAERLAAEQAASVISETQARIPATEKTEQGEQFVLPGAEQSARQAAAAREAEGHGKIVSEVPQQAPGGLFEPPEPGQEAFAWGPETGAISFAPPPPPPPLSLEEAQQSILSKLSVGQAAPKRRMTFSRLYTNVFDRLYPISEATPEALATSDDPYRLSRLLAGEAGKIEHFLTKGTFDFGSYEINGPSLQKVLEPVKDDLDGFRAFAAAARGLELEARGITTGLDLATMRRVAREGIGKYGQTLDDLVGYQNRVAAYLRDAGVLSRDGYGAMLEANQLYVPFQRVMEQNYAGASGTSLQARNPVQRIKGSERLIIDPIESVIRNTAAMVTMADRNEAGNALIRTLTREGEIGLGERQPIKAIQLPPDPALDAALKTYLSEHGVEDQEGLLDLLHAAASPPETKGTISVFRDGTRYTYDVDPDLAAAWKGLDSQSAAVAEKIMRPFASMLRAGAVLTPDFALRHTIRDFLYAAVTSRGFFSPADMARGFLGLINKDEDYWRWLQGGGANISMVSIDRRYLQDDIARLTEQSGIMTRAVNVVADPQATWLDKGGAIAGLPFRAAGHYLLRPLQVLTELAENASHLGAFKKALRGIEAESDTALTKQDIQDAAFTSRDVAVDAARMGAKTRAYNMITAFANITLQDSDRVVRAFVNNPAATALKIGAGISLPSALLWWASHDDPRYKELPQWEKDLFWVIPTDKWEDVGPAAQYGPPNPGTPYRVQSDRLQVNNGAIFRIPKPWGMGIIFGTGVERALEAFAAHNPDAFRHWGDSIADVSIPSFVPTGVSPILNQLTNRDTFTNRTLIPGQMEKWLPEYQYTPYTTEAAKAIGKIVGAFPGVRATSINQDSPVAGGVARALTSPILIENYVRGWTGTLGNYVLSLGDLALKKLGIEPDPPQPSRTLADIPVVKAFVARYPTATTESIQDFEDQYRANRVYYDTWIAKAKEGDVQATQRIQSLGGPRMFMNLDGINKALQEHNKVVRDINQNTEMTPSDKRQLIDTIYYRMIELGQAGKAALTEINKTLH